MGLQAVWISRLPGTKTLVICPEAYWRQWEAQQKACFPMLNNDDGQRLYWHSRELRTWDQKGRMRVSHSLLKYAGLDIENTGLLIGCGDYFELWAAMSFEALEADYQRKLGDVREPGHASTPNYQRPLCGNEVKLGNKYPG